ncbi:MAG: alpha/beta hydrolase [Cyanobacteria bacterium P01_A01_bin.116]
MPIADILGAPHAYNFVPSAAADVSLTGVLSPGATHRKGSHTQTAKTSLVFIHGWLLSQSYWQPLVSQLSPDFSCLTYDMRGFGESLSKASLTQTAAPASAKATRDVVLPPHKTWYPQNLDAQQLYSVSAYSLAAYAHDLSLLLDQLALDNVWLVGHSLGGSVALWAAYLFPDRVKGVICLNAGGGIYIPKEFEKFRSAGQQMVKYRPAWLPKVPLLPSLFSRVMVHKTLAVKWGRQRLEDFVGADKAAAEGALLESTTGEEVHQLPKLVGQLTQRVHFITATQDTVMLPRYVNYLASFHPQFVAGEMVSEIPDCGHMAMVEQPKAVADIISRVLLD